MVLTKTRKVNSSYQDTAVTSSGINKRLKNDRENTWTHMCLHDFLVFLGGKVRYRLE